MLEYVFCYKYVLKLYLNMDLKFFFFKYEQLKNQACRCQRKKAFCKVLLGWLCVSEELFLSFSLCHTKALNHHFYNYHCAMRKLNFPIDGLKSEYWWKPDADCK